MPQSLIERRESALTAQYGELMSMDEVASMLRYPTAGAAHKALKRGTFPIRMMQLPQRRGLFATTRVVAAYLSSLDADQEGSNGTTETPK